MHMLGVKLEKQVWVRIFSDPDPCQIGSDPSSLLRSIKLQMDYGLSPMGS
jgi:hypothetical protein